MKTLVSATDNSSTLNISGLANDMTDQYANISVLNVATVEEAKAAAANGKVVLFGYQNLNPAPKNHGHVGTLSVGDNLVKGEIANVGARNGFFPISNGEGAVFKKATAQSVHFYILSATVTPKTSTDQTAVSKTPLKLNVYGTIQFYSH